MLATGDAWAEVGRHTIQVRQVFILWHIYGPCPINYFKKTIWKWNLNIVLVSVSSILLQLRFRWRLFFWLFYQVLFSSLLKVLLNRHSLIGDGLGTSSGHWLCNGTKVDARRDSSTRLQSNSGPILLLFTPIFFFSYIFSSQMKNFSSFFFCNFFYILCESETL